MPGLLCRGSAVPKKIGWEGRDSAQPTLMEEISLMSDERGAVAGCPFFKPTFGGIQANGAGVEAGKGAVMVFKSNLRAFASSRTRAELSSRFG
jgi:hypothetical protein